jgi:hypothetical protein
MCGRSLLAQATYLALRNWVVIAVVAAFASVSAAQERGVTLRVENDFLDSRGRRQDVTLKLWSEKPANPRNSVVQQRIPAGRVVEITLVSPDRYTAEVQWQKHIFRTVPMKLKAAASDENNRGRVLKIGTLASAAPGDAPPPPALLLAFGKRGVPAYADSGEPMQMFPEPSNFPRLVNFRNQLRDKTGRPVGVMVTIRAQQPLTVPGQTYKPGSQSIEAGATRAFNLVSPDPFTIEIAAGDVRFTAEDLPLKHGLMQASDDGTFLQLSSADDGTPVLQFHGVYDDKFHDADNDAPVNLLKKQ